MQELWHNPRNYYCCGCLFQITIIFNCIFPFFGGQMTTHHHSRCVTQTVLFEIPVVSKSICSRAIPAAFYLLHCLFSSCTVCIRNTFCTRGDDARQPIRNLFPKQSATCRSGPFLLKSLPRLIQFIYTVSKAKHVNAPGPY